MKIGILSNGALCLPLLQLCKSNKLPVAVFADATSATEDLPLLMHFCNTAGIAMHSEQPDELYNWLQATKPDVVFIIGYGRLINMDRVPAQPGGQFFNIHFGALPEYKGPTPVFWHFKNGAKTLSVSIHRINRKLDEGPLVWQKHIERASHFNYGTANTILSHVAMEGVAFLIQHIAQQKWPAEIPQDGSKARYYKRPAPKDVLIDWERMQASEIIDLIQACNPWNKGAASYYNGNQVKIIDAMACTLSSDHDAPPGTILRVGAALEIAALNKQGISVTMLNLDGSFVPARYAAQYGFVPGSKMGSITP